MPLFLHAIKFVAKFVCFDYGVLLQICSIIGLQYALNFATNIRPEGS